MAAQSSEHMFLKYKYTIVAIYPFYTPIGCIISFLYYVLDLSARFTNSLLLAVKYSTQLARFICNFVFSVNLFYILLVNTISDKPITAQASAGNFVFGPYFSGWFFVIMCTSFNVDVLDE